MSSVISAVLLAGMNAAGGISAAEAAADPVADGAVSAEDFALAKAKETGRPYELLSARSESSDTWALPDGSWSVKRYGTPVRIWRGGAWVPADPSLAFAADGRVVSKAATVSVAFSGGGSGPLLTGVTDGRTVSLSWPTPLPKPTLTGNVATYPEVLPGVDLRVKAEVEGFSELLVVKTAEAARQPGLATLQFKLDTVGLAVSTDAATGAITAVNPAGRTVFTSPSPLMWDSTTASAPAPKTAAKSAAREAAAAAAPASPADAFVPPAGAQNAHMPTTVADGTLQIRPDQALLTGATTKYPVFIDPSWAMNTRQNWTRVYAKYKNNSYWNTQEDVRVGYEDETNGLSRSFFQFDTSDIKGAQVKKSTFRIRNTWSWSCEARPVELWGVGAIYSDTTWNRQPSKDFRLDTVNDAKGWGDCAPGNLEFDATALGVKAAAGGWANVTVGLYAGDESDTFGWKRFDPKSAVFETQYNNPPGTPARLGTDPATPCQSGGALGNTRISLYATVDDPDAGALTAEFQLFKTGQGTPAATADVLAAKGQVATWTVPDANLPTGQYTWKIRAKDQDGATSGWSESCAFSVDRARPDKQPSISSPEFPSGDAGWPAVTGKARTPGTFTFGANGVADVDRIVYYTDSDPGLRTVAPGGSVTLTPPGSGPRMVYAYSVDRAGNRSDTTTYLYYAARSQARDGAGDLNGDGQRDIWTTDSAGSLLTYAGRGDGKFSPAAPGGMTFPNAQVTGSGDWGQDGYNDLVSLEYVTAAQKKMLWAYPNDGQGAVTADRAALTVSCPVKDPALGCDFGAGWTGDDHWYNAEQVLDAGDLNADGAPDLLVRQGRQLWAYYGSRTSRTLDRRGGPVLVGNGDWDRFTVIAPGDLNADGVPDLWLRDDASGDLLRTYGSKGPDGKLDPTTWGNPASRVKIASGLGKAAYPKVDTVGDVTGDGMPDLWAAHANNQLAVFAGTGTPQDVNGISQTPAFLSNITAPTAQWKLTSQTGTTTPSAVGAFPGTVSGITWPSAVIAGRSTPYAAFTGTKATIRTAGPVVDVRKSFTVSTWAKVPAGGGMVLSQDQTRSSALTLFADPATGRWNFGIAKADADSWPYDWAAAAVNADAARYNADSWTQLTAVYDAAIGRMSLYVNGVLAGSGVHLASSSPAPGGPLVMGAYKRDGQVDDYYGGFKGGISNLAVYPYAAPVTAPGSSGVIALASSPGNCLDNDHGQTGDTNKIQIWSCNGTDPQQFTLAADGSVRVQGKCIDPAYAGTTEGTKIWLYQCNGSYGQQFLAHADGTLFHPRSGLCLDIHDTNAGTQLQLWSCNSTNAQKWSIPILSTAPLPVPLW
ncbi:ricin-type beta-trefoil lectin domain protein [Streptomyces sp. NPDC089919]|uniref:ricin-type beta-trefoil lectin domain protein n=1 Tax=Streptomyces sp. NPDC089919 TaxID=3155188 RepID=UPI00342D1120